MVHPEWWLRRREVRVHLDEMDVDDESEPEASGCRGVCWRAKA